METKLQLPLLWVAIGSSLAAFCLIRTFTSINNKQSSMKITTRSHAMITRSLARKVPTDSPAKISGYAAAYIFNNWTFQHNVALHDVLKTKETEIALLKERVRVLEDMQRANNLQIGELVRTVNQVEDDNEMYHEVLHEIFEHNPVIRWEMRNRVNFSDLEPVDPALAIFGSDSEVESVDTDTNSWERETLETDLQDQLEQDIDDW